MKIQVCSNEVPTPFLEGILLQKLENTSFTLKNLLQQNQWANFNQIGTMHLWVKGIQVCSNVGPCLFWRRDNYEIAKTHRWNFKIFCSRTTGPISTKLGTKHPWVKGSQVCSNEGPCPFPKGENYEIAKIHWPNIKIFFSRTTFNQIWHKTSLGEGDSSLFQWRTVLFL